MWDEYIQICVQARGKAAEIESSLGDGARNLRATTPKAVDAAREFWYRSIRELLAIERFYEIADAAGLAPFKPETNLVDAYFKRVKLVWPVLQPAFWLTKNGTIRARPELFALAQHHGVPTSLLDWTPSAFTAAFFAASEAVHWAPGGKRRQTPVAREIAVLAVLPDKGTLADTRIKVVQCHLTPSAYMLAQAGRFTVDDHCFEVGGELPPDETVPHSEVTDGPASPRCLKFTLPTDECLSLLRLLYEHRISHVHLKPTLDSVRLTMLASERW